MCIQGMLFIGTINDIDDTINDINDICTLFSIINVPSIQLIHKQDVFLRRLQNNEKQIEFLT